MPDFAICQSGFAAKGITNGKQMCEILLQEFEVAVRFYLSKVVTL